jgi:ketosteroid isomerase-like protein
MSKKRSKNIETVLDILDAEVRGDAKRALKLLDPRYSMTWVYQAKNGMLFPKSGKNIERELAKVYPIKGRQYDIKHIAEGKNVVIVEMIESYPNPKTKKVYRTPLVIVLEMKEGKIKRGRHYCDPRLSYLFLTKKQVQKVFK